MLRATLMLAATLASSAAFGQSALLQGGPFVPGHVPMYVGQGSTQPIVQDSGTAAGGPLGVGLSELGVTSRSPTNTYPSANTGTGALNTHGCFYDAPTNNATGYHYLCLDPNAQGGGLLAYGAMGSAAQLPLNVIINGVSQQLGSTAVVVGTTINGGTQGGLLYNSGGFLANSLPLGLNVLNALTSNLNQTGGVVGYSGALGTPISGNAANLTGLPAAAVSLTGITAGNVLYNNAGTIGGVAAVNNGVLATNGSGVPSISTTLPSGLAMQTPASITLTNGTGLIAATGIAPYSVIAGGLARTLPARQADSVSVFEGFSSASSIADVTSYTGALDHTAEVNNAIALAGALGKDVYFPAGFYNIATGHLSAAYPGQVLYGEGWPELSASPPTIPNAGTILNFGYLAATDPYGFYVTATDVTIRDMEIDTTQPGPPTLVSFTGTTVANNLTINVSSTSGLSVGQTVTGPGAGIPYGATIASIGTGTITLNASHAPTTSGSGIGLTASAAWTPNVGPWAIYAYGAQFANVGGHRLHVEHVMLRNDYNGINLLQVRGGYIREVYGQPFNIGLNVDGNGDEPHFNDMHFGWPYWTGNAAVLAYEHAHFTAYQFGRVDNPKAVNLFTYYANIGFRFYYENTLGNSSYNGETQAFQGSNLESDGVNIGIQAEDNPDLRIANFQTYVDSTNTTSACFNGLGVVNPVSDNNFRLSGVNWTCQGSYGSALKFNYNPTTPVQPQVLNMANIRVASYAIGGSGVAITGGSNVTVNLNGFTADNVTSIPALYFGVTISPSPTNQNFPGNVTATDFTALSGNPKILLGNTSAGTNLKFWQMYGDTSGVFHLCAYDDALSTCTDAVTFPHASRNPTFTGGNLTISSTNSGSQNILQIANGGTTNGSGSRLFLSTGTANSYLITQLVENGSGASSLTFNLGSAVTGGFNFQSTMTVGTLATATGGYVCQSGGLLSTEASSCPPSDERVKHDIATISDADFMQKMMSKRAVRFTYNDKVNIKGRQIGVAIGNERGDEWQRDFPELVTIDDDGTRHFAYQNFTGLLLKMGQTEQIEIDNLNEEIVSLRKSLAKMENRWK